MGAVAERVERETVVAESLRTALVQQVLQPASVVPCVRGARAVGVGDATQSAVGHVGVARIDVARGIRQRLQAIGGIQGVRDGHAIRIDQLAAVAVEVIRYATSSLNNRNAFAEMISCCPLNCYRSPRVGSGWPVTSPAQCRGTIPTVCTVLQRESQARSSRLVALSSLRVISSLVS